MKPYILFEHTADIGMEIYGETQKELFQNAAWAVMDVMIKKKNGRPLPEQTRAIEIEGTDAADLLVNFLREILYLFNGQKVIVEACNIKTIQSQKIEAILTEIPFDQRKHAIKRELKAVTYHLLSVTKENKKWKARVVFDV